MTYTLAFVDSITPSPTTRLNLNGGDWSLQAGGTDFSPPTLRRAVVSTLLADGVLIPSAAYDNRVVTLKLYCTALTDDAAATAVQNLARELDRPKNVLMYQPGTSTPVFFRTLRADFNAIQWDPVAKFATVHIPAEPFAYGPVTSLAPVTVYNDPAYRPALNANPDFESSATPWAGVNGATVARSTAQAHLGSASLLITPNGTSAVPQAQSEEVAVTAGGSYILQGWLWSQTATTRKIAVFWYNSSHGLITSNEISQALTAQTWTQYGPTAFTAPAGAAWARVMTNDPGTPAASAFWYADQLQISDASASPIGCTLDITGVKGDVETPLILSLPEQPGIGNMQRPTSLVAVRRRGTPAQMPFVVQAESLSLVTFDITLPGNDAAMSGSGSNYARVDFSSTPGLTERLTGKASAAASGTDLRGTYRVFARLRATTQNDSFTVQLAWGATPVGSVSNARVLNDAVTVTNNLTPAQTYGPYLVDLGLVQMPPGGDPVHDGYSGVEVPVEALTIQLRAGRVAGTGPLDIDCLLFVPADDKLLLVKWAQKDTVGTASADALVIDGAHEMITKLWTSGGTRIANSPAASLSGGFPAVSPNVTNRIIFVRSVGVPDDKTVDPISGSTAITASYYPRYLYVRPVTT